MKLNTISEGTWYVISNYLNTNFNKLSIAAGKFKGTTLTTFKGVYTSEAELKNLFPSPSSGDFAFVIVGNNQSFKIYYTNLNFEWVTDDGTYDPEVILKDYIEMIALSSNITQDLARDIELYNQGK